MKYVTYAAFFLMFLTVTLFVGCNSDDDSLTENNLIINENNIAYMSLLNAEIKDDSIVDKSEINEELTLGRALDSFGTPRVSERNSIYPLVYSWNISDTEILYIVFEIDNREDFMEKLRNGDYILPSEPIQYGDQGVRFATDNELKVLREWTRDHKAVYAYIVHDGEKNVLFDSR